MKFAFIQAEKAELGVARLCRALGVSRAGFYEWCRRPQSAHDAEDERLKVLVHEAFQQGRTYYGRPRVHRALKKKGERTSGKRVGRLMQEEGLVGRARWIVTVVYLVASFSLLGVLFFFTALSFDR